MRVALTYLDRGLDSSIRNARQIPADARAQAEAKNLEIAADNGHGEGLRRRQAERKHTVREAVLEAIKGSDGNQHTQKQYVRLYNTFSTFLSESMPGVRFWSDVDEKTVVDYHAWSKAQEVSWDTVRQRIAVVRLCSKYMTRTYPGQYRVVTDSVRLKRKDPPKADLDAKDVILSPCQIRSFLSWLEERNPMIHAWACMGGLAGMRMKEYCYLREQDIDFERGTITITETEAHKPKTRSSYRIIPVCDAVIDSLRRWIDGMEKKHPMGFLFFPKRQHWQSLKASNPETKAGCYSTDAFSRRFVNAIKEARADGINLPPKFIAKKLRASFMTAMRSVEPVPCDYHDLQAYCGHEPDNTMAKHYDVPSLERLGKIATLAQGMVGAGG